MPASRPGRAGGRAGTAAITPASLRGPSPAGLRIDPSAAQQAATQVLTAGHATGEVIIPGRKVPVTHVSQHATLLAAFGVSDLCAQATATATPLQGTTTGRSE
jgi:hypothetical protein